MVCRKPPTRHTCYMSVAKNCISAPLPNTVWTQRSVPLSTCVSVPSTPPLPHNATHTPANHKCTCTLSRTQRNTSSDTWSYSVPLKKKQMPVLRPTHIKRHANKHPLADTYTHTHTFVFTITPSSRQIVYHSIGSLTKWCMAVVL